ncbi:hypothetical protein [Flavobacterium humidisoli]|uniref:Lipocalin-like domain-containing protein n=1 Tax=Flavobacterium humidisoli TaxID=2937442 RepID=A0ABY4LSX8_9FLAO|nr:hypothetical protein [Flavobacterium humidisoli]UPZ15952.1 hypothetical protein M0M44_01075 [Flavobacterium humidisoli]
MSKSLIKNGVAIFLILNVFLSMSSFAQTDIVGEWKTNDIIGYTDVAEYSLTKVKEANYGRRLTFKLDGIFFCDAPVQCLNDCFVFTSGTYTQVDNDHIHLIVKDAHILGLNCGMKQIKKEGIVKDLGIFYIYKEGDSIRLIPSNGVLDDNKKVSQVRSETIKTKTI